MDASFIFHLYLFSFLLCAKSLPTLQSQYECQLQWDCAFSLLFRAGGRFKVQEAVIYCEAGFKIDLNCLDRTCGGAYQHGAEKSKWRGNVLDVSKFGTRNSEGLQVMETGRTRRRC